MAEQQGINNQYMQPANKLKGLAEQNVDHEINQGRMAVEMDKITKERDAAVSELAKINQINPQEEMVNAAYAETVNGMAQGIDPTEMMGVLVNSYGLDQDMAVGMIEDVADTIQKSQDQNQSLGRFTMGQLQQ